LALSSLITITQYKIKQAQCNPIPIEKQIVIVCAIVEGYLNEIHTMI
jgi:F0F1-type ATP synthase alpha subunit